MNVNATATRALIEARKIRKRIINSHGNYNGLQGWCGIASIRLAAKLGSAESLRYGDWHVWNEVSGYIVDITATQFEPEIGGVLIYKAPASRSYHGVVTLKGMDVIKRAADKITCLDDCVLCKAYARALLPFGVGGYER